MEKITIAIDAMGGDFSPKNEVWGVRDFLSDEKYFNSEIQLFGNKEKILYEMEQINFSDDRVIVIDAPEKVEFTDNPSEIFRTKKDSSLFKGFSAVKEGTAQGFISAGNTGAMVVGATLILGRIKGVSRPVIGTYFPTIDKDKKVFILDVGANVDCKARFLYEYAVLGTSFCKAVGGLENPSIGLLSVGEEDNKGTEEIKEANKLLKESNLNFFGNVEGSDILKGKTDIVVFDGFVGNAILKLSESFPVLIKEKIKAVAYKNIFNKIKALILKPFMKEAMSDLNYELFGGVPILGTKGVAIVCHGKSSPTAFKNAIINAYNLVQYDFIKSIENSLN